MFQIHKITLAWNTAKVCIFTAVSFQTGVHHVAHIRECFTICWSAHVTKAMAAHAVVPLSVTATVLVHIVAQKGHKGTVTRLKAMSCHISYFTITVWENHSVEISVPASLPFRFNQGDWLPYTWFTIIIFGLSMQLPKQSFKIGHDPFHIL